MKWVKSKIVMLPTEKATNHCITKSMTSNKLFYNPTEKMARLHSINEGASIQHLYFLSNEEIKEGDYVIEDIGGIVYGPIDRKSVIRNPKKIIATTNEELGHGDEFGAFYQLPRIHIEFIKEYCKAGGIDEVLVGYEYNHDDTVPFPKTIEGQEFKLKVAPDNTITIKLIKENYSREEVIKLIYKATDETCFRPALLDNWIKENL